MAEYATYDVVVVGAGSAGICAAAAAHASGAKVAVIECQHTIGGQATLSMVGTICGLHAAQHQAPRIIVGGFARELGQRIAEQSGFEAEEFGQVAFQPYHPDILDLEYRKLLVGCDVFFNTSLEQVVIQSNKIEAITCRQGDHIIEFNTAAVIDCSGASAVSCIANLATVPECKQASAFSIFMQPTQQTSVRTQLLYAHKQVRTAVKSGVLPSACGQLSFVPQATFNRPIIVKLGVSTSERNFDFYLSQANLLVNFLEKQCGWTLVRMAEQIGQRSNPTPIAAYQLKNSDVLSGKKFSDAIAAGIWPAEFWPEDGGQVVLHSLPKQDFYQIPAGSLKSALVSNLWFAGKCIGAEWLALASARVIGTCWQTGYAAGKLAAAQALGFSIVQTVAELHTSQGGTKLDER